MTLARRARHGAPAARATTTCRSCCSATPTRSSGTATSALCARCGRGGRGRLAGGGPAVRGGGRAARPHATRHGLRLIPLIAPTTPRGARRGDPGARPRVRLLHHGDGRDRCATRRWPRISAEHVAALRGVHGAADRRRVSASATASRRAGRPSRPTRWWSAARWCGRRAKGRLAELVRNCGRRWTLSVERCPRRRNATDE